MSPYTYTVQKYKLYNFLQLRIILQLPVCEYHLMRERDKKPPVPSDFNLQPFVMFWFRYVVGWTIGLPLSTTDRGLLWQMTKFPTGQNWRRKNWQPIQSGMSCAHQLFQMQRSLIHYTMNSAGILIPIVNCYRQTESKFRYRMWWTYLMAF